MGKRPDQDGGTTGVPVAEPAKSATPAVPRRILVVEDERITQAVISFILKGAGYVVTTAKDAAAALKVLRVEKPDLMTLDIDLSRDAAGETWDGFRIIEWLRRYRPEDRIPFIIITAGNPAVTKERARSLGAFAYLSKPVDKPHLLEMVREAIGTPNTPSTPESHSPPPKPPAVPPTPRKPA